MLALDLDHPSRLALLVKEQTELGHKARYGAHELYHAGVSVAAGAEHGVCVHDRRRLRPREDIALVGLVADLIEIAGAGVVIVTGDAKLHELLFVIVLHGVHEFLEHKILNEAAGHVLIQRLGVGGEFLVGGETGIDDLLIQIIHRLHDLEAEADDGVAAL